MLSGNQEKVIGVRFDKSDAILSLIKEGHLLATMSQNPDVMGYEGMKTPAKLWPVSATGADYVDTRGVRH